MIIFSNEEVKEMQKQLGKSEKDYWFTREDIEKFCKKYDIKVDKEYIGNIITNTKRLIMFGELLQKEGVN